MKKLIYLFTIGISLCTSDTIAQNVNKDYFDGQVYIKVRKEIPLTFSTKREVNIYEKLSFLAPFVEKYKINKAHASFYFSKSDTLQRTFRIYFENSTMVSQLLSDLKGLKQLEYAERVPIMRSNYSPGDLQANTLTGQYYLYNVKAQQAWDIARGNSTVAIAIVDNAVDIFHRDLSPNVVSAWDVSDDDPFPMPPQSNNPSWNHGTHVAGIAAARTDNGFGVASISFNCGLMAIKATEDDNVDVGDITSITTIDNGYEGIAWAAENGARVINCSWGSRGSSATGQAVVNLAHALNAVVVAAAGNESTPVILYPAAYNNVLSVAAVGMNDVKVGFSNFGSQVDVSAPGVAINSTIRNNSFGLKDGTSMASPLVAGLCGLIRSLNTGMSNDDVINCVKSNTDNIDAQNPTLIGQLGTGRINAFKAVICAFPCNGSINLGSGIYTVLNTQSSGTITSANTIPLSARVSLDAAIAVILQPGFNAVEGSVFHAYIDGCGGVLTSTKSSNNTTVSKNETVNVRSSVNENFLRVYPNPSHDKFNFSYQLSRTENVSISIYASDLKLVKQIINQKQPAGTHVVVFDAVDLVSGIYFAKVVTGINVKTLKLIVAY